jgi:hypothetical protein
MERAQLELTPPNVAHLARDQSPSVEERMLLDVSKKLMFAPMEANLFTLPENAAHRANHNALFATLNAPQLKYAFQRGMVQLFASTRDELDFSLDEDFLITPLLQLTKLTLVMNSVSLLWRS